ncbi:MAG: dipicolinate synthase subunit B [Oscillospiraceae bacterium]|nr:dipicolinate synthase subunit B [Oscillospiraceae bacterium]
MDLTDKKIGFAITGSFCTFEKTFLALEALSKTGADIYPIMSENVYSTDTRFGKCADFIARAEKICGKKIIKSVKEAEPIGPKQMLDILVIAPCTGNTIAKIASGIADSSVTMAVKAHLRNCRPVVIAVSTNDALANAAKNIGMLLNYKNIYFVPFGQDDYIKKPNSLVADFTKLNAAIDAALENKQLQPILCCLS